MRSLLLAAALFGLAANAQAAPAGHDLTWGPVTLYGTVDVDLTHQTRGAPLDEDYPQGLEHLISKNSGRSLTTAAHSGLSQTKIGLKAKVPLTSDLALTAQVETGFSPLSLRLTDGPRSLVKNNGVALARQSSNGDSSRAGQVLNGVAFIGLASKAAGTLTFGRQNSLMLDNIVAYDPQAAAYAFSPIGYSGAAGGMGATEDARVDRALKYRHARGAYRLAALYKTGGATGGARHAYEIDLGGDHRGLSMDAIYNKVDGAMTASSLSAAQLAAGAPADSLAVTVSDNVSYGLFAKYAKGPFKLYGGWERIIYSNPKTPVTAGSRTLGGYPISVANNAAYPHRKVLDIAWAGARYAVNPRLDLAAAYYVYAQNSYRGDGCGDARSSACSGGMTAVSVVADYKVNTRFDVYGGAMYSRARDGMAAGFLATSTVNPTLGLRYSF